MDIKVMRTQYENGELPAENTLAFFSELLKSQEELSENDSAIILSLINDGYLDQEGNQIKRLDGTPLNTYTVYTQVRLVNTFRAVSEEDVKEQVENMELPDNYHEDSFEILKTVLNETYYQPVYDRKIWDEGLSGDGFYDHLVYHNKERAKTDFPTLEIIEYHDDDIENIVYVD